MGYGVGPYGFGPFGDPGTGTILTVVSAWAISTHTVRVTLSSEPRHADRFEPGDALNTTSWQIANVDTAEFFTVADAKMFDPVTVDITTLEAFGDHLERHNVAAIDLLSITGSLITPPDSADFLGVVQTIDPIEAVSVDDFRDRDLSNPPFQVNRPSGVAGTLVIGDDGDFTTEAGAPLIKKLIMRRLNTIRGSFRHLPNYGVGILEKEPLSPGGLVELLRDIEDQCSQEPDVAAVKANGSLDRSGLLVILVRVVPTGGSSAVNIRMSSAGGRLVEL